MKLFAVTYVLNIIDYAFTVYWINAYGMGIEANPLGRWMFENNLTAFIKIFVVGALFVLLAYLTKKSPKAIKAGRLLFGVYSVIVIYHTTMALYIG